MFLMLIRTQLCPKSHPLTLRILIVLIFSLHLTGCGLPFGFLVKETEKVAEDVIEEELELGVCSSSMLKS